MYEEIASLDTGKRFQADNFSPWEIAPDPVPVPTHLLPSDSIIVDAHATLLEQLSIVNKENYKKAYAHWRGSPPRIVDSHPKRESPSNHCK